MRIIVLQEFHDINNMSVVYREGDTMDFEDERAMSLLSRGLAKLAEEPIAEPTEEPIAEPTEEKVEEPINEEDKAEEPVKEKAPRKGRGKKAEE